MLTACLRGFSQVCLCQIPFQQESAEIGKCVDVIAEADITAGELDAAVDVVILLTGTQCTGGFCRAVFRLDLNRSHKNERVFQALSHFMSEFCSYLHKTAQMCCGISFQATDRDDTHAIRTAIGKIAGSGQDHQEGGRVHFIGINFSAIAFRLFAPSSMRLSPPSLISTSPYFPFLK